MKTILLLTWTPILKHTYQKVYKFDKLSKKCKIIVVDVSSIIFKGHKDSLFEEKKHIKALKIKTLPEYLKKIKNFKIDLIINLTGIREENKIFEDFKKKNVKIVNFINNHLTEDYFFPSKLLLYLKYFIKKYIYSKNLKQNINIVGGKSFLNHYSSINAHEIKSHSINYNTLLENPQNIKRKRKINKIKKNIVYIDSGFHFHPDLIYHKKIKDNKNKEFNIKSYSKKINHLFLNFKKQGYKVFFLSHPKIKKKNQIIYKNCTKIENKVDQYIKYSDLVIWSGSSTIDFPIIYKKKNTYN